jgi:hypothetical protein
MTSNSLFSILSILVLVAACDGSPSAELVLPTGPPAVDEAVTVDVSEPLADEAAESTLCEAYGERLAEIRQLLPTATRPQAAELRETIATFEILFADACG